MFFPWLHLTQLFTGLLQSPVVHAHDSSLIAVTCSFTGTLVELIDCLDKYTVRGDTYTAGGYAAAQPTVLQRKAWKDTIQAMLWINDNCTDLVLPDSISPFFRISLFTDDRTSPEPTYCILSETTAIAASRPYYTKGWGLFVVPASRSLIQRDLHISAPHPLYDGRTPQQAAAVFSAGEVGGRSLLVPGRHRRALRKETGCVPSPATSTYWVTDPVHDTVCVVFFWYVDFLGG